MSELLPQVPVLEAGCPYAGDIASCPLYIESHETRGLGCVDDLARPCKVKRGTMSFDGAVMALAAAGVAYPGMIERLPTAGRA